MKTYANLINKQFIHGKIPHAECMKILDDFQHDPKIKTFFVSKVTDASFDLTDANIIIRGGIFLLIYFKFKFTLIYI